jgi:hypothetical protein
MVEYCFECGNKIKRGHNKKWNLRPHEAFHLDDVCECEAPSNQFSPRGKDLLAQLAEKGREL